MTTSLSARVTRRAAEAQRCPQGHTAESSHSSPAIPCSMSQSFQHPCGVGCTNPFHRQEDRGPERLDDQPDAT